MKKALVVVCLTPVLLSSVSWILTQLYVFICSPKTLWGFLLMPVHLGSPVCHTLATLQYEIGTHYISLWASSGAAFLYLLKSSKPAEKKKKLAPKTPFEMYRAGTQATDGDSDCSDDDSNLNDIFGIN